MEYVVMAGQLILSLSILVVLHEWGHFFPARLFGTRVEKFYLFFDAGFSLFKRKIGETEYGIGWLPLGGYVKISGMIDESMDLEQMKQPAQPWEFRAKPAWQRLIIMLGGVTVNFILGFLIFMMITWTWGDEYIPTKNLDYGIVTDSLGRDLGLRDGDVVLKVGDKVLDKFNSGTFKGEILIQKARTFEVQRAGRTQELSITDAQAASLTKKGNTEYSLYAPRFPFVAAEDFPDDSPAKEAGIQAGDRIFELNGKATPYFHDFYQTIIAERPKQPKRGGLISRLFGKSSEEASEEKPIQRMVKVSVARSQGNRIDTIPFEFQTTKQGFIGVVPVGLDSDTIEYGFFESIPKGIQKGVDNMSTQAKALYMIFTGQLSAKDNLGSFFTIGKAFGGTWDWRRFWFLTGTLSFVLAIMNLLPIPGLDGGHVMFLCYEMITGRKPNEKVLEYATTAGILLILSLMIFVIGLDIWRNFF